jgi:hypothetical protein
MFSIIPESAINAPSVPKIRAILRIAETDGLSKKAFISRPSYPNVCGSTYIKAKRRSQTRRMVKTPSSQQVMRLFALCLM